MYKTRVQRNPVHFIEVLFIICAAVNTLQTETQHWVCCATFDARTTYNASTYQGFLVKDTVS